MFYLDLQKARLRIHSQPFQTPINWIINLNHRFHLNCPQHHRACVYYTFNNGLLISRRDGDLCSGSQLSGGGDRLCARLHWHAAGGGQAGGDQREGRAAGIIWDTWGGRQLPVETPRKKWPFLGHFYSLFWLTCLKKGNMTKVECSTTETESFL